MSYFNSEKDNDPWASTYQTKVPAYSFDAQPVAPEPSFAAPQPDFSAPATTFSAQPEAPQQAFPAPQPDFSGQSATPQQAFPAPPPPFAAPQTAFAAQTEAPLPAFPAPQPAFAQPAIQAIPTYQSAPGAAPGYNPQNYTYKPQTALKACQKGEVIVSQEDDDKSICSCGRCCCFFFIFFFILIIIDKLNGPSIATSFVDRGSIDGITRGICDGDYKYTVSSSGIIESENYPASYNPSSTCTNQFDTEASGITFEFQSFLTQKGNDFIIFRDVDGNDFGGSYCSGNLQGTRISISSSRLPVSIYFESDEADERSGFSIAVSAGFDHSNDIHKILCGY